MSKITCPVCAARVPLPKRRRPLSGPGPGRAYESPLCPSCDTDLSERIAEHRARWKRRKLGVFSKAALICVGLCFVCIAGNLIVFDLEPPPPWKNDVKLAFKVGTEVFLALGMLMKIGYKLFEE